MQLWLHTYRPLHLLQDCLLWLLREKTAFKILMKIFISQEKAQRVEARLSDCSPWQGGGRGDVDGGHLVAHVSHLQEQGKQDRAQL